MSWLYLFDNSESCMISNLVHFNMHENVEDAGTTAISMLKLFSHLFVLKLYLFNSIIEVNI